MPSELTRIQPDSHVIDFFRNVARSDLYLSVMTVGEIRKGIASLPTSSKQKTLLQWFEFDLLLWFSGRILPVTQTVAERWGMLTAASRQRGIAVSVVDGLLAATALESGLTLATRNVRDFADLGVPIINPWEHNGLDLV